VFLFGDIKTKEILAESLFFWENEESPAKSEGEG